VGEAIGQHEAILTQGIAITDKGESSESGGGGSRRELLLDELKGLYTAHSTVLGMPFAKLGKWHIPGAFFETALGIVVPPNARKS
jgi:hypothetical protein